MASPEVQPAGPPEVHDTIAALPCGHVVCEDCLPALGLALDAGTPDVRTARLRPLGLKERNDSWGRLKEI